jgi:hypothetical protein
MGWRMTSKPSGIGPLTSHFRNRYASELPSCRTTPEGGFTGERKSPMTSTGTARTRPRRGPAIPMSNRTFRLGMGERMRMMAPIVPMGGTGSGTK